MSDLVNQDFIEIWMVWHRGWGGQRKFKEIAREKMPVQKFSNSPFLTWFLPLIRTCFTFLTSLKNINQCKVPVLDKIGSHKRERSPY